MHTGSHREDRATHLPWWIRGSNRNVQTPMQLHPKPQHSTTHNPYDSKTSMAPHTHFSGSTSSMKPPSKEHTNKAWVKYRHVCSHTRPQHSTTCNPYESKMSTVPHTCFGSSSPSMTPPSKEHTDKAQAKHRHACSHPRPQP
ncbi:hypothetical protein BS47DRAFT_1358770 [Hydnum rufescens UP504]|uniref:Uncharacterized protein n=1 Tax=Hydnum rufescens UP504 TaxID=1448309 RepID=A0A9P6E0Z4_9AGAM|nr:hypothetical protein BS47DRAFT_1358770 [Hydnum rufescens UP504]